MLQSGKGPTEKLQNRSPSLKVDWLNLLSSSNGPIKFADATLARWLRLEADSLYELGHQNLTGAWLKSVLTISEAFVNETRE